ncbi:MAG: STAS domain-containing protein [Acidobacteriota bacterium]
MELGANGQSEPLVVNRVDTSESLQLAVAGRMSANGIGELRRLIEDARRRRKPVCVDLAEVTLVDRVSVEYLCEVVKYHVRLENPPSYLRNWIGLKD